MSPKHSLSRHPGELQSNGAPTDARFKISSHTVHNRVLAILAHTTRYAFKSETRLAADSGVSKSALNRLVIGQSSPSFALVVAITEAIEKELGRTIDPREIVSLDGNYPTASVCEVVGCTGCLPSVAYDDEEFMRSEYRTTAPGTWSGSVPPRDRNRANEGE